MSGYVKAYRKRFKNPMFEGEKWCRGYCFDWLVSEASYKPRPYEVGGKYITLDRGQLCVSVRYLAEKWNWSKSAVDRFLTRLKTGTGNGPMIETASGTGQLIITICNYEKYQADDGEAGTVSGTVAGTPTGTAAGQQRDKTEERQERKEGNKKDAGARAKPKPVDILSKILTPETASAFCEMRAKLRAPLTPRAAENIAKKLSESPDPEACANLSIENGWRSVFPESRQLQVINGGQSYDRQNNTTGIADEIATAARAR